MKYMQISVIFVVSLNHKFIKFRLGFGQSYPYVVEQATLKTVPGFSFYLKHG